MGCIKKDKLIPHSLVKHRNGIISMVNDDGTVGIFRNRFDKDLKCSYGSGFDIVEVFESAWKEEYEGVRVVIGNTEALVSAGKAAFLKRLLNEP